MQDYVRVKMVAGVDVIVAILLFIVGILITILGLDYINLWSEFAPYQGYNPFTSFSIPWIIFIFGLATIIYGLKRLIDDILNMISTIS